MHRLVRKRIDRVVRVCRAVRVVVRQHIARLVVYFVASIFTGWTFFWALVVGFLLLITSDSTGSGYAFLVFVGAMFLLILGQALLFLRRLKVMKSFIWSLLNENGLMTHRTLCGHILTLWQTDKEEASDLFPEALEEMIDAGRIEVVENKRTLPSYVLVRDREVQKSLSF